MSHGIPRRLGHVVIADGDGQPAEVFVMQLPDGPPLVLRGSAALIWILAAQGNSDVVGSLSEIVGRPAADIAPDVHTYLDELVARRLLEPSEPGSTRPSPAPDARKDS